MMNQDFLEPVLLNLDFFWLCCAEAGITQHDTDSQEVLKTHKTEESCLKSTHMAQKF